MVRAAVLVNIGQDLSRLLLFVVLRYLDEEVKSVLDISELVNHFLEHGLEILIVLLVHGVLQSMLHRVSQIEL